MEEHAEDVNFEDFERRSREPLARYLRRFVGDQETAADLLQETMLRIARGLPQFAGRASLKTWAFSIATRVAADHLRKPERRLQILDIHDADAGSAPDVERSTEEQLVVDEMNACVRQVIDSLPADYRAALVLHDLEGLNGQQVADACGCSLATAKIRIHRARERLRQALHLECSFYHDHDNVLRCDRKP